MGERGKDRREDISGKIGRQKKMLEGWQRKRAKEN